MGKARKTPIYANKFVKFFFERFEEQKWKVPDFEKRSGLEWRTVMKWRRGVKPDLNTLLIALNTVGYDLKICPKFGVNDAISVSIPPALGMVG